MADWAVLQCRHFSADIEVLGSFFCYFYDSLESLFIGCWDAAIRYLTVSQYSLNAV